MLISVKTVKLDCRGQKFLNLAKGKEDMLKNDMNHYIRQNLLVNFVSFLGKITPLCEKISHYATL